LKQKASKCQNPDFQAQDQVSRENNQEYMTGVVRKALQNYQINVQGDDTIPAFNEVNIPSESDKIDIREKINRFIQPSASDLFQGITQMKT
jgi:hypothetical protein